jgi:hypothetical protein
MLECEFASDLASLSRGWLRGLLAGFNRCFELAIRCMISISIFEPRTALLYVTAMSIGPSTSKRRAGFVADKGPATQLVFNECAGCPSTG